MGNIIAFLQEIFMQKENNSSKIGLSEFKKIKKPVGKVIKKHVAKELNLSDLMKKNY